MITKKQAAINGNSLTYYEMGQGKSIFFLHGGRLRAKTFQSLLYDLSKHYRVIAPDIPGYGESSTPTAAWIYNDYASFFNAFLKKLQIKDVTVIGYSMGGGIGYHLASQTKDISQLILVDAAGIEKSTAKSFKRDFNRLFFYLTHLQYFSTLFILIKEYILFVSKHMANLQHIEQIRKQMEDSSSYIFNISVPTHIIWANNDEIFPVEIAHRLHKSIKNSTIEIVDGGHDWPIYNSRMFSQLILKKLPRYISITPM